MRDTKITLSLVLCSLLASSMGAQTIYIDNFFYRDFLDMGQNKGAFSAGASNIKLDSIKNPGVSVSFDMPFLDQSARSNNGSITALGRNFGVTAYHVGNPWTSPDKNENLNTWGITFYQAAKDVSDNYGKDVKFMRYSKYIVEGQTELLQTNIQGITTTQTTNTDWNKEKKNIELLKQALETLKDDKGNIYLFQAGQGELSINGGEANVDINEQGIQNQSGLRGGSFGIISSYDDGSLKVSYESMNLAGGKRTNRGLSLIFTPNEHMTNSQSRGDSGSGFYVYDSKNKKWVLLAVTTQSWAGDTKISFVGQSDFEDYKKNYEQGVDLKKLVGNGNPIVMNNGSVGGQTMQGNKDIVFSSGGNIEVQANIYRNISGQVGGFVFKADSGASESNPTTYKFTNKTGQVYGFDGAGLDIEKNARVEWGLGFIDNKTGKSDALHKVGEGTLIIKTNDSSNNTTSNHHGYLRVGDGKVVFDTDKQAFKGVYITSGRATLELVKGKGEAFGAEKDTSQLDTRFKNHFILKQEDKTDMGLAFGNGGGVLDLKGNSLTTNTIVSNDSNANIINTEKSESDMSYITLEGLGYDAQKKKGQNKVDTIIHASFGQSTDSESKTQNNNLTLIYKGDEHQAQENKANLIFDGNINAKGLEVSSGNVTLQGHPTTHSYIRDSNLLDKIKQAEGSKLPSWLDLSRPSTLEQPDWDHRIFKIEKIDLQSAKLSLGRESTLEATIKADKDSKLNFGGDIDHFIDKKDGENVTDAGFGYQQEVEKKKLEAETQKLANQSIHFKGTIEASGSEINSSIYDFNAKLNLKEGAKLKAEYLTLDRGTHANGAIATLSGSGTSAEVKNLIFKSLNGSANDVISLADSASFKFTQSLGFESSTFDLGSLDSIKGLTKPQDYDIFAKDSSTITGANTDITGNVGVMSGSSLTLKDVHLKTLTGGADSESSLKNSIIVEGDNSKLTAQKIDSQSQDNTNIFVIGAITSTQSAIKNITQGATLTTTSGINLNGTQAQGVDSVCEGKFGADCFTQNQTSESKDISNILAMQGGKIDSNLKATKLKLNVQVDKDSTFLGKDKKLEANASSVALNFEAGKEQEFDIVADNKSHITLNSWAGASYKDNEEALKKAIESSSYKGKIEGKNSSVIDSNLGNITASVDLQSGAKLNIKEGGILTLKDTFNSIALKGEHTALNANTIIADKLTSLTFSVDDKATFNVKDFVFKGGSVSTSKYYGQNVWLQDNAQLTLAGGGTIAHNLYIDGKSSFSVQGNDSILEGGKSIMVADDSTFKVGSSGGNGTLSISESNETKIQTELGSKLEINKLLADKGSNVYVSLDLAKTDKPESPTNTITSQQKNFDITANNGSNVYVNSWDMNREGFDTSSPTTSLITDKDSRIHFATLTNDMSKTNYITSPIQANLTISQHLKLDNVGKATNTNPLLQTSQAAHSRDITSENAPTPKNEQFSESDPLKLAAQVGTSDDRFHALKLQGNTMGQNGVVQNDGKNLTLEQGIHIEINLDSSVNANATNSQNSKDSFMLNKYYTLISAGSITDNREDKRIYFNFANAAEKLYWVTIVENGEIKVKFTKEDPSSYNELKNYINNDTLLAILIQHDSKNDYVQMAGMANQHNELENFLGRIDSDFGSMASGSSTSINDKVLNSNNQSINTRLFQAKYARSRFSVSPRKLASNGDLAQALRLLKDMEQNNNAWLSMGAGAFSETNSQILSFYSTNIGYDRLFTFSGSELVLGAMAGFGGSNYKGANITQASMLTSFGLYTHWQNNAHEFQSNLSFSLISGDRSVQGVLGAEKAQASAFGLLSMSYYKYRFILSEGERYEHILKPVGLLSLGLNSMGDYKGANYTQKAFNDTYIGLGAGLEYALSSEKSSYAISLLVRQNIYNSTDKVFVSLSNAQNFMSYTLNPLAPTFELNFMGSTLFGKSFSLQYGLGAMIDTQGGYGGKGDVKFGYRF